MGKKRLAIILLTCCFVVVAFVLTFNEAIAKKKRVVLRFSHAPIGCTTHMVSVAMKKLLEDHSDFLRLSLMPSKSYVVDLSRLAEGQTDIASSSAFLIKQQVEGTGDFFKGKKSTDARALWSNLNVTFGVYVAKGSKIQTMKDLDGKKVTGSVVPSLSSTFAFALFEALGIKPKYHGLSSYTDQISGLKDGTYDAITTATGIGTPAFVNLFTTMPCRIIPLASDEWEKIEKIRPGWFNYYKVPPGVYPGADVAVPCLASASFIVIHKEVPDDVVYELCKVWWEHTDEAIAIHKRAATYASRKDWVPLTCAAPRHPGALKYFKETGLLK